MSFTVIIPARYASTRLPGKLLADIQSKPMIQHVWESAMKSGASQVLVATDDERIRSACVAFGARAELTAASHRSGTERIAELASRLRCEPEAIIVNVQGDEPLIPPSLISQVAENLEATTDAQVATLCERITVGASVLDPSVVKVVFDKDGFANYFSRAPIPWDRDGFATGRERVDLSKRYYRHVGIYAYRAGYLGIYITLPQSPAERSERLEQLRVLHHGGRIHVAEARERPGPGVDTPADLEAVRAMMQRGKESNSP
jgi:3-deoxy-manno-octulosonate cytidylyltransferase (CMP-KDO synthetase)